jgi:hypothetical protein
VKVLNVWLVICLSILTPEGACRGVG